MGFVFVDGFDHYTGLPGKWTSATANLGIGPSYGRFSTNGLRCQDWNQRLTKTVPTQTTYYVGAALYFPSQGYSLARVILAFHEGATGGSVHVALDRGADGKLVVRMGHEWPGSGTVLGTSVSVYPLAEWHYIEMMTTIGDSPNGAVTVKVDGVDWITVTGADTRNGQNGNITTVQFFGAQSTQNPQYVYIDDVYIHDSAFQGDCRIIYRAPEAAGAHSEWTPSTGDNFECVNEAAPATADYVETDVLDEIDTYEMTDIDETAGTVLAVVGNYYCQKTDAGARQIAMATELPSSPSEHLVSDGQAVPSSWGYLQFIQETKPGGGAWTVQDTKDAEMGMKLTA